MHKLDFRKGIMFLAAAWLGFSGCAAIAQSSKAPDAAAVAGTDAAGHVQAFDVVSIRPSRPGGIPSGAGQLTEDEYRAVGWPLWITIGKAYLPPLFAYGRSSILNAPDWMLNDNYDFVGKVATDDVAEWQKQGQNWNTRSQNKMLQAMLQTALAERCKLVVHLVPGETPGYALVVDKHGPNWKNLKESKPDEKTPSDALMIAEGGMLVPYMPGGEPVVTYFHTSMASLAEWLSTVGIGPVVDRTGLNGKYDFALTKWDPESETPRMWNLGALGLKLIPIKAPAETLVIDHIERPSPN